MKTFSSFAQSVRELFNKTQQDNSVTENDKPDAVNASALFALNLFLRLHEKRIPAVQLKQQYDAIEYFDQFFFSQALHEQGLKVDYKKITLKKLSKQPMPVVLRLSNQEFAILVKCTEEKALLQFHDQKQSTEVSLETLNNHWRGEVFVLSGKQEEASQKFGFKWFLQTFLKYRHIVKETLLASAFIQVLALLSPLVFMVIIDKVFSHNSLSTLDVLMLAMVIISLFEVLLSALRSYLMAHTTNRIDLELGLRLFRHMITLPLSYFQSRRVGDTIARMREVESVRAFITGTGLTTLLDLFFVVIFISVMFLFSPFLTLIVIATLPIFFLVAFIMTPLLKDRLDDKYERGAENQSFLVETISGIETLKSSATEARVKRQWEERLANYTKASFSTTELASLTNSGISFVGKALIVVLLWLGAKEVLAGNMTVGQLIAFNMLAARVNAPVLRMAQIWQDFQGMQVAIKRLADILDTMVEPMHQTNKTLPEQIDGRIEFQHVDFKYNPDAVNVLKDITFTVNAGETVGVIGSSGSGKSTLIKLLQRLYIPSAGKIFIDGMNIVSTDVAWLRRQIGVVSQDCVLFNRSIRDNIALADPNIDDQAIMDAAKLAGAHDFILRLPEGYDTLVDERGSNFSMGQRQRIALARAMVIDPRILILDEATSSLDYESEKAIQENMAKICAGRTVLIIAHRFSTIRYVDRILTIEEGQLIENDTPHQLLANEGRFAQLHGIHQNETQQPLETPNLQSQTA
jgi:subfamily B ATP-binding cassette protein HlyB/CyaB